MVCTFLPGSCWRDVEQQTLAGRPLYVVHQGRSLDVVFNVETTLEFGLADAGFPALILLCLLLFCPFCLHDAVKNHDVLLVVRLNIGVGVVSNIQTRFVDI